MIQFEGLAKSFGKVQALAGVSLAVGAGELFAYLGPNGAGKTTTIRILTGLCRPGEGSIQVGGLDMATDPLGVKRLCGLVPQAVNLDSELSVAENLDVHGRLFGMSAAERRSRSADLLEYVGLTDKARAQVKTLSGGMKRRAMVARALMHSPRVLFLDEPTAGLDPAIRRRIWALVKQIQQDGATIFLTTHYIEEAEFLADRVAFLDQGRLVALDAPAALMERLGAWSVDVMDNHHMESRHFATREEAQAFAAGQANGFTVRRVNLEDVFMACTGRKIQ
ncbi:MAG: ABC transporter ATP-binding protein [Thermodesulfobacteriota bacterium]